jgi:hypothetical protein
MGLKEQVVKELQNHKFNCDVELVITSMNSPVEKIQGILLEAASRRTDELHLVNSLIEEIQKDLDTMYNQGLSHYVFAIYTIGNGFIRYGKAFKPSFLGIKAVDSSFVQKLENLINSYSIENESNTPDYILAAYIRESLNAYNNAINARENWYGRGPKKYADEDPEGYWDSKIITPPPSFVSSKLIKDISAGQAFDVRVDESK